MSGMLSIIAGRASAEPWSIEPLLGASADYDTNPALLEFNSNSEEHIAALIGLPLRYDADGIAASLSPSARISNSSGYSSLASSYTHIDGSAQFTNDLGSTTLQAGLARDSSLYHVGGLVNGVGVRRDTASTGADWTRSLTERSLLQLDASWTRVDYAQNAELLTDYKYLSAGPTFAYALTERDTVKVLSSYGRYQSLDGITESTSENLELGFVRQLNELWTLSTTAGYTRSTNSEKFFYGPFYLGTLSSNLNGAVYAATLSRQNEQFNFSGGVSRSLQPAGFSFLSRQDSVNLTATHVRSERWDFTLSTVWDQAHNPTPIIVQGALNTANIDIRYFYTQLTANWHWTQQWIISMHATRVSEQSHPTPFSAASSGVSVDIVRHFLRIDL
jgi:hypothetical protein